MEGPPSFQWARSSTRGWGGTKACSIVHVSTKNHTAAPQIRFQRCSWFCWKLSLSGQAHGHLVSLLVDLFFPHSLLIKHEGLCDVSHFGGWRESKRSPWTLTVLRFCWNNIKFTLTCSMGLNIDFQIIWNAVFINNYWQGEALFLEALVCTVRLYFFLFWSAACLLKTPFRKHLLSIKE